MSLGHGRRRALADFSGVGPARRSPLFTLTSARGSSLGSHPSAPFTLPRGPSVQPAGRCGQGMAPPFPPLPRPPSCDLCAPASKSACWQGSGPCEAESPGAHSLTSPSPED